MGIVTVTVAVVCGFRRCGGPSRAVDLRASQIFTEIRRPARQRAIGRTSGAVIASRLACCCIDLAVLCVSANVTRVVDNACLCLFRRWRLAGGPSTVVRDIGMAGIVGMGARQSQRRRGFQPCRGPRRVRRLHLKLGRVLPDKQIVVVGARVGTACTIGNRRFVAVVP